MGFGFAERPARCMVKDDEETLEVWWASEDWRHSCFAEIK